MRFADLPEDILVQIFALKVGLEVLRLWQSGDVKLRSRMLNGGVRSIYLKLGTVATPYFLPRCLESWKLERLSIVIDSSAIRRNSPLFFHSSAYATLKQLGKSLKYLRFGFHGAGELLFDAPAWIKEWSLPPTPDAHDSESLAKCAAIEHLDVDSWHFGTAFPRLETLRLGTRDHFTMYLPLLTNKLPESLTYLDAREMDNGDLNYLTFDGVFPPHLTAVALPYSSITMSNIHSLPHHITDMLQTGTQFEEITFVKLLMDHSTDAPTLLPNLIEFPFHGDLRTESWYNYFFENNSDQNDQSELEYAGLSLPRLPNGIRRLEFGDGANAHLDVPLPSCLTDLDLEESSTRPGSAARFSQWLPRGLTRLSMKAALVRDSKPVEWPPNLTSLTYLCNLERKGFELARLPRTLKHLDMSLFAAPTDIEPVLDCARLLLQENGLDRALWSESKARLLKKSLSADRPQQERIERYIGDVEKGQLLGLPIGLETLRIMYSHPTYDTRLIIPPSVHTLTMLRQPGRNAPINFEACFPLLPPSVIFLHPEKVQAAYYDWKNGESAQETSAMDTDA